MKIQRPSGLTLLAGALLLLMPALAVLQFRWVGQVSEAERVRMQRNVEFAALQFRENFNGELGRLWFDLQVSAATVREGSQERNWERYAERYDRWLSQTSHPEILKNVYVVALMDDELGVRRWDPSTRTFVTLEEWPSALSPARAAFEAELQDWRFGRRLDATRFQDVDELLVTGFFPSRQRTSMDPATGARQQTAEQTFGYTVLELNLPFITNNLLAELSQRHFTHPNGDTYRVEVVTNDEFAEPIYRSDPTVTIDPRRADARQGLFPIDPFSFGPAGGRPRGGPGPNGGADRRDPPAQVAASDSNASASTPAIEERPGRWRLLVQHQSGSLEAAVAGARTRNLAISMGVLMMLTLTIGLLTVTSRRAQRLAQQQMEFVAGVSHELRTPVAVIKSAAENLSQGIVGNTDRVKRYGQMIEGEARRLAEMVERVLQYAGIESGLGFGNKAPLAAGELINTAIDNALPLLGPETVVVDRDISDALPPIVGDAAALRSAVQNLVANAVKYGGRDRWVGVKAEHVQQGRRSEVHITVSDHGSGIPAEDLPHIFEPFYRGGDAVQRQVHGNGLGLSLVKRIVNAHGGRVTVTTRAGAGSSFIIALPAAQADQLTSVAPEQQRAAAHP